MSANHLSNRKNWQMGARITGDTGENEFVRKIADVLPDHYEIILKPKKIVLYSDGKGIILDTKITNLKTKKCIFVEKKTGNQGGNATEERAGKFLSKGIKRKVREQFDTPDQPFFTVFSGDIFNGRAGKQITYIIERKNNETLKVTRTKVHPKIYREKVELMFEDENYAIMDANFANISDVAEQIMDII